MYRVLSKAVKLFHLLWVVIVLVAPVWAWHSPTWQWVHLAMIAVTLLFFFWIGRCPITDLEKALLAKNDPAAAYSGAFIANLLGRDVKPRVIGLTTLAWGLVWGTVYWLLRPKLSP